MLPQGRIEVYYNGRVNEGLEKNISLRGNFSG